MHGPLGKWIGGALLLLALLLLGACRSEEPNVGVTIEDLDDDPSAYVGETVTISGEVETTYGLTSFTIGDDNIGSEVLIVVPPGAEIAGGAAAEEEAVVQVTGTVREYVVTDIESDLSIDLEPEVEIEYEGSRPAVIAEVIRIIPEEGNLTATEDVIGEPELDVEPVTDLLVLVSPELPETLIGRRVQLGEVQVQNMISDDAFFIGPAEDQRLFVSAGDVQYDVSQGDTVSVTGLMRLMPPTDSLQARFDVDQQVMNVLRQQPLYLEARQVTAPRPARAMTTDTTTAM